MHGCSKYFYDFQSNKVHHFISKKNHIMMLADILSNFLMYYIALILGYSIWIFDFFGFDVMSDEPINHPHWLIEWAVFIAVAVVTTVSLIFLTKRCILVIMRIYKKLKNLKRDL